jgi:alpha-tubulin suppressor-like RCC1 family protein
MWSLAQQMQARAASTWTGLPAVPSLYLWGRAHVGQIGDNNVGTGRSSPVQLTSSVSWSSADLGSQFAGAIKSDGTLWMWGGAGGGKLGINVSTNLSSPTQVGTDTNWSLISLGYFNTAAIKTNGTLWSWGSNSNELGLNDIIDRSSPVQVGALTNWLKVQAMYTHCVAIKTDGTLWGWGANENGQIGDNTTILRSSPVQIGAGTDWTNLGGHKKGIIAQKSSGTIWTWGRNAGDNSGTLALNDAIHRSSPVQIGADTDWILSQGAGISASSFLTKTNGTLWGFGYNNYGLLGTNNNIKRSSPVQIGSLTTWSKTAATSGTGFMVKTDGTLWASGNGEYYGQLANNIGGGATNYKSSPVQIGSSELWTDVKAGFEHVLAIETIPAT